MKTVILTGNQGNQKALSHKLAKVCDVAAIVVSENIPRRRPSPWRRCQMFFNRASNRLVGRPFVSSWFRMLAEYEQKFPDFPDVPVIRVRNVNDEATLEALERFAPDLTIVSGTNLVGRNVIAAAQRKIGIVNLHTGISPYVKGGPNCTNWCLAENWFHLIGNTVMWLDTGIDTGNIVTTEQTPLDGTEDLFGLHWKVMEHAHNLYVRAIARIAGGKPVPSVRQADITEGRIFYNAEWNAWRMRRALKNFRRNYARHFADAEERRRLTLALRLIPLKDHGFNA